MFRWPRPGQAPKYAFGETPDHRDGLHSTAVYGMVTLERFDDIFAIKCRRTHSCVGHGRQFGQTMSVHSRRQRNASLAVSRKGTSGGESYYYDRLVPMSLRIYGTPSRQSSSEVPEKLIPMKIRLLAFEFFSLIRIPPAQILHVAESLL